MLRCLFLLLALAGPLTAAWSVPLPRNELERQCWLRHTRERTHVDLREPTAVYFSNLRSGYRVRSPFLVEFAVRGMGVVPAGKALPGSGHHHLLVDTPLPPSVTDKIPFNNGHRHFGKGQTFVVLDLPPGEHKLRLLFADHDHRPYFVFSPEITVTVTGPRSAEPLKIDPADFDAGCTAWYQDELARPRGPGEWVAITNVREGEPLVSPVSLRFGVDGYGVCAAGQSADKTGRFALELLRDGKPQPTPDLANGATQANLFMAPGSYQLRLRFVDGTGKRDLLPPVEQTVQVTAQEKL